MKAVRLLQIIIVLAAGAYLVLLHDMNEVNVVLPFLFSLPPAAVLVLAMLLGWLLGWLPPSVRAARRAREVRRLNRRIAELEQHHPAYDDGGLQSPIIPDRPSLEADDTDPYDRHENL